MDKNTKKRKWKLKVIDLQLLTDITEQMSLKFSHKSIVTVYKSIPSLGVLVIMFINGLMRIQSVLNPYLKCSLSFYVIEAWLTLHL